MRIGIYNEPPGGAVGGSEFLVSVLAEALKQEHSVEIVHHRPTLERRTLEQYFGVDLGGISLRYEPRLPMRRGSAVSTLTGADEREWRAGYSRPYDLFVAVCHSIPPFCHAARGALIVLFPLYRRQAEWPWSEPPRHRLDVWRTARQAVHEYHWQSRLASYRQILSISEFTRHWTREYWGVDSTVVYPPVSLIEPARAKRKLIVSVGRFTASGHAKRHAELIEAFADMPELRGNGWSYESYGALSDDSADRHYFDGIARLAASAGVEVRPNVTRVELSSALGEAKVFLHAAGFGASEERPDLTEHFGIATVEAMSAGCVPVVIDRGAQPEIVRHGVNGLLWDSLDTLKAGVRQVAGDDELCRAMSERATLRARGFGRAAFVAGMKRALGLAGPQLTPVGFVSNRRAEA